MSDDTTTDPRLPSEPEPHRSLLCCDPADVDQLLERVRKMLAEPSTPITWEADHCNIISDFPRQVMLEAIKRLVSTHESRLARAEQAASTYHAWLRVLTNDWSDGRARAVAAGHAVTGLGGELVARLVDQPWREAFPIPTVGAAPGHLLADSAVSEPPLLPTNPAGPALDLDRLEATARGAQAMAPGPYTVDWLDFDDESGHVGRGIYDITDANKEQVVCGDNGVYPPRGALAEHIAGTSPDVVLRLIALARAATIDSGAIPRRGPGRAESLEQTPPGAGPAAAPACAFCGKEPPPAFDPPAPIGPEVLAHMDELRSAAERHLTSVYLERHKLYCLTPVVGQAPLAAAAALIRAIAKEHGPGRLWWAGPGVVNYLGWVVGSDAVSQWTISGVPHVALAAYYFHAPPARRWEDETSG